MAGDFAYVGSAFGGLRIINVANPAAPVQVGSYATPGYAIGVAVVGYYAYVAAYDSGLRIINVSDPAVPTEIGFYDTPGNSIGVTLAGG